MPNHGGAMTIIDSFNEELIFVNIEFAAPLLAPLLPGEENLFCRVAHSKKTILWVNIIGL